MANSTKAMRVECSWSPRSLKRVTCTDKDRKNLNVIVVSEILNCLYEKKQVFGFQTDLTAGRLKEGINIIFSGLQFIGISQNREQVRKCNRKH